MPTFAAEVELRFECEGPEAAGAALRRLSEAAQAVGFDLRRSRAVPAPPDAEDEPGWTSYGPPARLDYRLEVVQVPVSDVDRSKSFYSEQAGFDLDRDHWVTEEVRVVQLTPPGSACSIVLGTGLSDMEPGSVQGLQLVVADIGVAHAELAERGVEVSEIRELGRPGRPGFRFVFFSDPDGNGWVVQELRARGQDG